MTLIRAGHLPSGIPGCDGRSPLDTTMDPLQLGTPWAPGNDPDLDPREWKQASFGMLCSLRRFEPVLGTTHVVTRVFTESADALFSSVSVRIPFSGWLRAAKGRVGNSKDTEALSAPTAWR